MHIWRSSGWPCQDALEIDLLAAGLLQRHTTPDGHEQLRLSDAAIALLASMCGSRARVRRACMTASSTVWRSSSCCLQVASSGASWRCERRWTLRRNNPLVARCTRRRAMSLLRPSTPLALPSTDMLWADEAAQPLSLQRAARRIWRVARPDLFSIRKTSVPTYLQPMVHEVKASRADLLSDLRHAAKRHAYQWLSEECYYVFPAGVAQPEELPEEYGVWVMHGDVDDHPRFELLRPAKHVPCALPFAVWMALCKATPLQLDEEVRRAPGAAG